MTKSTVVKRGRKRPAADPSVSVEEVVLASSEPPESLDATAVRQTLAAPATPVISLSSNCTVKDAAALQMQLVNLVGTHAAVSFDVSSVERVDTATMQLLCAFVRDRSASNAVVKWIGNAPALLEAARLLGVESVLSLPAAGAA